MTKFMPGPSGFLWTQEWYATDKKLSVTKSTCATYALRITSVYSLFIS